MKTSKKSYCRHLHRYCCPVGETIGPLFSKALVSCLTQLWMVTDRGIAFLLFGLSCFRRIRGFSLARRKMLSFFTTDRGWMARIHARERWYCSLLVMKQSQFHLLLEYAIQAEKILLVSAFWLPIWVLVQYCIVIPLDFGLLSLAALTWLDLTWRILVVEGGASSVSGVQLFLSSRRCTSWYRCVIHYLQVRTLCRPTSLRHDRLDMY